MKTIHKLVAVTLLSSVLAGTAIAKEKHDNTDEALAAATATVTLDQAVTTALQTVPGTAVSAEFQTRKDTNTWEVEIVSADKLVHELQIDATTGAVTKQAMATDHESDEQSNDKADASSDDDASD